MRRQRWGQVVHIHARIIKAEDRWQEAGIPELGCQHWLGDCSVQSPSTDVKKPA